MSRLGALAPVNLESKMNIAMRCLKEAGLILIPLSLLGALASCGGSSTDSAIAPDPITRSATLTGDQEVPSVLSAATGTGTLTLDRSTGALTGSLTLDGMTATAAHVHQGAAGANGGVVVGLSETAPGTWSVPASTVLTESQMASFEAGTLYFNAHSAAHASGEIRGQIGREAYYASLSGAQEVPPTASGATGTGSVVFDPVTNSLTGSIALSGMSASAAHIHTGTVGANGGIAVHLSESPAGSGTWIVPANTVLTEAQAASLRAGEFYFNAHAPAFPAGEIRGQINRKVRHANLTGAQEVPPTASAATATGFLSVDPATRAVSGRITVSGVTPTAAHVHQGATGSNGGVQVHLVQSATDTSVWAVPANTILTVDQYRAFLEGNLYFNVHSAAFPAGEIRGQIDVGAAM